MRPTADIFVDCHADPPLERTVEAWEMFCDLVTDAERLDLYARWWLELRADFSPAGPLRIPEEIESDPRLDSYERFALAAFLDVGRDVDTTQAEASSAVCARIFGDVADRDERRVMLDALARLTRRGVLTPTVAGGYVRRLS